MSLQICLSPMQNICRRSRFLGSKVNLLSLRSTWLKFGNFFTVLLCKDWIMFERRIRFSNLWSPLRPSGNLLNWFSARSSWIKFKRQWKSLGRDESWFFAKLSHFRDFKAENPSGKALILLHPAPSFSKFTSLQISGGNAISWMLTIQSSWRKVNSPISEGKNPRLLWLKHKTRKFDSCRNPVGISVNWLWSSAKTWRFSSVTSSIGGIIILLLFNNNVFTLTSSFKESGSTVRSRWLRFKTVHSELIAVNSILSTSFWAAWYI